MSKKREHSQSAAQQTNQRNNQQDNVFEDLAWTGAFPLFDNETGNSLSRPYEGAANTYEDSDEYMDEQYDDLMQ